MIKKIKSEIKKGLVNMAVKTEMDLTENLTYDVGLSDEDLENVMRKEFADNYSCKDLLHVYGCNTLRKIANKLIDRSNKEIEKVGEDKRVGIYEAIANKRDEAK